VRAPTPAAPSLLPGQRRRWRSAVWDRFPWVDSRHNALNLRPPRCPRLSFTGARSPKGAGVGREEKSPLSVSSRVPLRSWRPASGGFLAFLRLQSELAAAAGEREVMAMVCPDDATSGVPYGRSSCFVAFRDCRKGPILRPQQNSHPRSPAPGAELPREPPRWVPASGAAAERSAVYRLHSSCLQKPAIFGRIKRKNKPKSCLWVCFQGCCGGTSCRGRRSPGLLCAG